MNGLYRRSIFFMTAIFLTSIMAGGSALAADSKAFTPKLNLKASGNTKAIKEDPKKLGKVGQGVTAPKNVKGVVTPSGVRRVTAPKNVKGILAPGEVRGGINMKPQGGKDKPDVPKPGGLNAMQGGSSGGMPVRPGMGGGINMQPTEKLPGKIGPNKLGGEFSCGGASDMRSESKPHSKPAPKPDPKKLGGLNTMQGGSSGGMPVKPGMGGGINMQPVEKLPGKIGPKKLGGFAGGTGINMKSKPQPKPDPKKLGGLNEMQGGSSGGMPIRPGMGGGINMQPVEKLPGKIGPKKLEGLEGLEGL